ncbi:unnamed protein product [[Candida] boidinii]|nr:unnamed protein product [[Candida] boidinii]
MPEDEAKVFGELSLDSESLVFAKYYFDAKLQYRGNYFRERNYTSTREILEQSIAVGVLDYNFDSIEEHRVNSLDSLFFGKCCGLLGHLYLRGEGTNQDYNRAYDLLFLASKYTNSTQVAVDLGLIHEYGLSDDLIPDPQTAKAFYSGHKFPLIGSDTDLAKAAYHSGRVTLKLKDERYGYNIIEAAAYKSNSEALYHLAQCFERGIKPSKSEDIATIYKIFVEKIEPVVSPLKWAFDSAMDGDNEMALLGYAMAAELGYESAQSSAAYLLYPKVSFLEEKPYIPINRFKCALNYYLRSANQNNLDSAVFLGDMHYYGLRRRLATNSSSTASLSDAAAKVSIDEGKLNVSTNDTYLIPVDYSKAANLYHKAANELSSQARFNLDYN